MKKIVLLTISLVLLMASVCFAGAWVQDGDYWKYDKGNGVFAIDEWENIDGIDYHFDDLGHMATGDSTIVFFDLLGIFIDAIMYAIVFEKSGNSVISFIPHCLNNMLGLVLIRLLFM